MEIGEQHLPGPELLALGSERLLDLHDQLGAGKNLIGIGRDLGAHGLVIGIGQARAQSRRPLDDDLVAARGQLPHRRGHEADPEFAILDFSRYPDEHDHVSRMSRGLESPLILWARALGCYFQATKLITADMPPCALPSCISRSSSTIFMLRNPGKASSSMARV